MITFTGGTTPASTTTSDRRSLQIAASALIVGSVLAVDPWGWAPFGPLRWAVVSSLMALLPAIALREAPLVVHGLSAAGWLVFLGWGAVAGIGALDPLYTWLGTPERHLGLLTVALFAGTFFAAQQLHQPDSIRTLLRAAAVALLVIGGYTVLEVFDAAPVDLIASRPGGPYGTAAYLGAACALLVPITVGAFFDGLGSSIWRAVAGGAAALGVVAALASQTRAGWFGLVVAMVIALAADRARLRRMWPAVAAGAAVLIIVASVTPVGPRTAAAFDFSDGTARGRVDEWQVGAAVAVNHPVLGVGFEGYRAAFSEGVDADYERRYTRATMPDRAHSGPLDIAVTTGIPGLAVYLVSLVFLGRRSWRALAAGPPWLGGIGAGVAGYLGQQLFLFPLAEVDPLFWLFAGILVAAFPGGRMVVMTPPRRLWIAPFGLATILLAAGILDVAADRQAAAAGDALAAGRLGAALESADSAARLRPDSFRYHLIAAVVAAEPRTVPAYRDAIDRVEQALDLSPHDPILRAEHAGYMLRLAQAARDPDILREAIAAWAKLVADDPVHAQYRLELGSGYAIAGDSGAAEEQWLIAADLAPTSTRPLTNLAALYLDTGRRVAAAAALDRARALNPADPEVIRLTAIQTP